MTSAVATEVHSDGPTRVGIIASGVHIPYWRLRRATVDAAYGRPAGRGSRAVAGPDEDTTTMAVEAARRAVRATGADPAIGAVLLATSTPAYVDKTNATAVHAALLLPPDVHAADVGGAVRSGVAALLAGLYRPGRTLVALADVRTGAGSGADEIGSGDAAAALVVGSAEPGALRAEFLGSGAASAEFLDRWRSPGEPWSSSWEERFGEREYTRLAALSLEGALKSTGLAAGDIGRIAITGLAPRAAKGFLARSGVATEAVLPDVSGVIGYTGTAHAGIALAALLDAAEPGQVLALTVLADGADTLLFRATENVRVPDTLAAQIARGTGDVSYVDFLSWRGLLTRQQPRRPAPDRAAAPPSLRRADWKFAFVGSRCTECDTRHLPPQRVCLRCGATDRMVAQPLADALGTVATYTVDHLAFSLAPPVVAAVIDFDGGGRYSCELTDLGAVEPAVGSRVEMTFRRISSADGVHNYFWKARPASSEGER
ncbi:OB-fold domain-containing protein [Pseudonocardia sp. GCM10023141]|uniref:OB-fold domain-containing protein n=1 Tax=Pseudonocardia sp. GCM10023141 TaxID=3252653 RepID=UPI0036118E56